MDILQDVWFLLIGVLLIGYAILDGFDLGVGVLHLFAKNEQERRISLNAIGPVWDGNEVWLLTGGGALFAAFPVVYATVFSGFYLALMLLLMALIMRAVSMEFRGKVNAQGWKRVWDTLFGVGSLLPAVLFGVAYGNILRGIPLNADGVFTGSFLGLLNPYAILVGVLSLATLVMHGAVYLTLKTDGQLQDRLAGYASRAWYAVVALYVIATAATVYVSPFLFAGILTNFFFWLSALLVIGATYYVRVMVKTKRFFKAFLASSATITGMIGVSASSLFPRLVPSLTNLSYSLTVRNASSSELTLTVMLVIALIGMPLVITYSIIIHRVFRGRVVISPESY
jgi:cytochrome d ubiquinol oxidase subunit II